MTKKDIPLSLDDLDENPLVEWANKNKWNIAYGIAFFFMAVFLLYRFFAGAQLKNEKDFFEADNLASKLSVAAEAEKSLVELKQIVSIHPELEAKYDGVMAETYLLLDKPDDAKPLIERNLKRIDESPYSQKSATIALLVGENKLQEAKDQTLSLKKDLESLNPNPFPILYLYNFYRLISLNNALGNAAEEKALINEWFNLPKNGGKYSITPFIFDAFINTLNLGEVSFLNYIQDRQNRLQ